MQSTPEKTIHSVSSILDLPKYILADILSRLPINSIYDCIYVCKAWYDLLSDPYFTTLYRKRPAYISLLLSLYSDCASFPWYFQLVELKWDKDSNDYSKIDLRKFLKTPHTSRNVKFWGCCNGLLCLSHCSYPHKKQYDIYICNPMLGEFVKLPQPNMEAEQYYTQDFGFGCHPTTGQYKVLRIIAKQVKGGDELKSEAEVFTLGVDHTWRSVGDGPLPLVASFCKIPLRGALHWLVEYDNENPYFIYSFDIKEEKVRSIPPPIGIVEKDTTCLVVLRNCLCVFSRICHRPGYPEELVIWWMKRYGVVESWTKQIIGTGYQTYQPIATWRNGEILMYTGLDGLLLFYNSKKKKKKKKKKNGDDGFCVSGGSPLLSVTPFVTSCFSLKNIVKDGDVEVVKLNRAGRTEQVVDQTFMWFRGFE